MSDATFALTMLTALAALAALAAALGSWRTALETRRSEDGSAGTASAGRNSGHPSGHLAAARNEQPFTA